MASKQLEDNLLVSMDFMMCTLTDCSVAGAASEVNLNSA